MIVFPVQVQLNFQNLKCERVFEATKGTGEVGFLQLLQMLEKFELDSTTLLRLIEVVTLAGRKDCHFVGSFKVSGLVRVSVSWLVSPKTSCDSPLKLH